MTGKFISIDGGTSNTRISLICDGAITDRINLTGGARDGFEKRKLRECIEKLLVSNKLNADEIETVLASGMLTSREGLCEIPYITAPAGLKEIHNAIVRKRMPEICEIPFSFIPGVKIPSRKLETADVMRGEETELMGLNVEITDSLVLLPGSHSKCITVSSDSKIVDFHTYLTGEMTHAISKDTILSKTVNMKCEPDRKYLKIGYEYCAKKGINETLFKTRILDMIFKTDGNQSYGFFMGGLLYGEINRIISFPQRRIVVAGKKELKYPTVFLLKEYSEKEIICVDDASADNAPTMGLLKIYSYVGS